MDNDSFVVADLKRNQMSPMSLPLGLKRQKARHTKRKKLLSCQKLTKTPNFDRFWAFSVDFSWHRELERKEKRKISVAAARAWLDGFGISFDEGGV